MIIASMTTKYINFSQFVPNFAFGWVASISQLGYEQSSDYNSDYEFEAITERRTIIDNLSIFIGGESRKRYLKKDSLQDCINDEESFYFNISTQLLYVHINHDIFPDSEIIAMYEERNYTGATGETGVFYDYNDIEYLPKLLTLPQIFIETDPLVYSRMAFLSQYLEFDNTPDISTGIGEFDDFIETPIPGSELTLKYIPSEQLENPTPIRRCDPVASVTSSCDPVATEYTISSNSLLYKLYYLWTGLVSKDSISLDIYGIEAIDKRQEETKNIPDGRYDSTTYPNLKNNVIGKVIAEGYGVVRGVECFCLTGTSGSGNQTFKFAKDASAITTIYVQTDDAWDEVTAVSTDATNGEFVLSAADSLTSKGSPKRVKADVTLRAIHNPGDIIVDILDRYLGIEYDATEYDIDKWVAEKAYLEDVGIVFNKNKDIFEWIEELQNGSNYGFRYDIAGDGKRYLKVDLLTRSNIDSLEWIDLLEPPIVNRDFTQYASKVQVNYAKDYKDNDYFIATNTDFEEETIKSYNIAKTYEVNSLLTTQSDADEKALNIINDYKDVKPIMSLITKKDSLLDADIYDFINADLSEPAVLEGWTEIEITSSDPVSATTRSCDPVSSTRSVSTVFSTPIYSQPERSFWGTRNCKIIGKIFDAATDQIIIRVQGEI